MQKFKLGREVKNRFELHKIDKIKEVGICWIKYRVDG